MIMKIESYLVRMPLKSKFTISTGSTDDYEGVFVVLSEEHMGIKGYGEAVPSPRVTGETPEGVVGKVIENMERIVSEGYSNIVNSPDVLKGSAWAGVDIALWDFILKAMDMRVDQYFPIEKKSIRTSITIAEDCLSYVPLAARRAVEDYDVKELKIKLMGDVERDIARVRVIREMYDDIGIRVDANTAYDYKRARKVLEAIRRYDIEFIEQPMPVGHEKEMLQLQRETDVPVMLDESMHTVVDARKFADMGFTHMNIKLMKCGGITGALDILELARERKLTMQVGCMIESHIGITAGTIVALLKGIVKYADLDGITFLPANYGINGGVKIEKGEIVLESKGPGLGYSVDDEIFKKTEK